jgi:hypothetical protein
MASSYFRSLVLTCLLSFLAPLVLVGGAIAFFLLLGFLPGLDAVGQAGDRMMMFFLATFGNGNAWEGMIVIGCACAVVGAMLDTYSFYRHYSFRKL